VLADGLSLVYSFYDPSLTKRSLGSFIILDHILQAQLNALPYVYQGYWVPGSEKMAYKARFSPLEILKPGGWALMSARERGARPPKPVGCGSNAGVELSDAEPAELGGFPSPGKP
jgi:arginine-tRNA-protein transferase